jgi:FkbM family methyltransferase
MLKILKSFFRKITTSAIRYKHHPINLKLEKLGSDYGGWIIPSQLINERSICYLVGAGEDISFDVEVASRFHCRVYIFDPTPKAKVHFEMLVNSAITGTPFHINNNPAHAYKINKEVTTHLKFYGIGIWTEKNILKFFSPQDDTHISHSISNLQQTNSYFEAQVERLSDIMHINHHERLDIVKLDIEGAEYEVIDSILQDNLFINVLCVEFHLLKNKGGFKLIQSTVSKLEKNNFLVIAKEGLDFTFLNKNSIIEI